MSLKKLLCLALLAPASSVVADTVWLKNGDRLSGKIKFYDGSKLVLETDYGGNIALDWQQVSTLQSDQEMLVKQDAVTGERVKSLHPAQPGQVLLANGDEPKVVELASIEQILKPKPLVEDFIWKGNIDASMDYKRADADTDDYDINLKTRARHGLWRHNAQADYNRELRDEVLTTDHWGLEYALDRFITDHWFWQGRAEYKRDQIEDLSRQRTLGSGPGYQFWDNELGALSVAGLLNRTDYEFVSGQKANFYSAGLKWDYNRYIVGRTVELYSDGDLGKPLDSVADYTLDAAVGLRYKVTDWASLNMRAEKDMVSGSAGDIDETRYTLGFGVGW